MRSSCLGRGGLIALLVLVVVLSAMRGVAGSWDATPLATLDVRGIGAAIGGGVSTVLAAVGDFLGRLLGAVWSALAAVPWLHAGAAVLGFVGDLLTGFWALLRDLGAVIFAAVTGLGRGLAGLAEAGWAGLVARVRSLAYDPSGDPLDRGRLALFATGWVVVLVLIGWVVIRLLARWLRSLRERVVHRGGPPSRRGTHARA